MGLNKCSACDSDQVSDGGKTYNLLILCHSFYLNVFHAILLYHILFILFCCEILFYSKPSYSI